MIRILFVFIALAAGLYLGTQYSGDQGYVLISIAGKTLEMSVTTLVVIIVALLAALFLLEAIIKKSLSATSATWNWFSVRKQKRARKLTNEGIIKLVEGDWKSAEKKVTRWSNSHDMPLLCYLVAAEAAHAQGNLRKRDQYLELASQQEDAKLAVGLTKAKQHMGTGDFATAFDVLSDLKADYPKNPALLKLLKTCYTELNLWHPLIELLPTLRNTKAADKAELQQLAAKAQSGYILELATHEGLDGVTRYWDRLPKSQKQDTGVIIAFVTALTSRGGDATAFTVLKEAIAKNPDPELLAALPSINYSDSHAVTSLLKKLLKKYGDNAGIHSTLGQIYIKEQKWGDAQVALEEALKIRPNVSDYGHLAIALHNLNFDNAATEVSQKAMLLLNDNS